ncbi:MAG: hypothetical protein VW875_12265, partial [Planctomycetaceae bacterium]
FSDLLDVSAYQGKSILSGGAGDDFLYGGPNIDVISGNAGDDVITGGFANDTLDGGPGADRIFEEGRDSANISLTNFQLQFDSEIDQITGFEKATIKTGDGPNTINALEFTGLSNSTELVQIYGNRPYQNAAGPRVNLTGIAASTSLASLNNGQGVRSVANPSGTPDANMDFQIRLSDSEMFSVDVSSATTLQELMNAIVMASNTALGEQGRLEVSFTQPHGTSLQLSGSKPDDNLSVIALNNSFAAADLGILKDNQGTLLVGSSISDLASDLRIIKTNGVEVNVDLADQLTLNAIFEALNSSDPDLSVSLTDDLKAIQVIDSSGGDLPLTVIDLNGANIASTLGLTGQATLGSPARIVGNEISVAAVILDGGGGTDHLTGSPGNDFISGGTGNDVLRGGGGYDTIGAVRDLDMTLHSGTLEFGDGEIDTHESFEAALLTGGAGINRIDTSNFDGPARIDGGGGGDTLLGGAHDDVFGVSGSGLETPGAVQVDVGGGTQNSVVVSGTSSGLTQSLLDHVTLTGTGGRTLVWTGNGDDHLTVDEDIILPVNLEIRAPRSITITGQTIDTSDSTQPGSIILKSELITVDGGSKLLALQTTPHTDGSFSHGDITLQAKFDNALMGFFGVEGANSGFLGFANLDYNKTSITVGTSEIRGGDVELTTHSDTAHFVAIPDYEGAGEFFNSVYDTGLSALENFSAFAGYSFSESVADINLGTNDVAAGPTIIRADNFTAHSKGVAGVKSSPLGIAVGVAIARAKTHSVVNLHDVNLQATEDVIIRSSSSQSAFSQADVEGAKGVSAAVAVSIIESNTIANVSGASQLTVGRDLYVQADNIDQLTNMARSVTGGDGRAGLAVAIDVEDGTTNAILDGIANVSGNVNVTSITDKTGINQSKFFAIFPAESSGVEASAGTGTNETGDLLKDYQQKAKAAAKAKAGQTALAKKAAKKLPKVVTDFLDDRDDSIDPKFQFAAGVAIEIDTNSATSRIGNDTADTSADIEADGTITVSTVVNASPKVVANSSSQWKEGQRTLEAEHLSSNELKETDTVKQPDYAVSISLAYGDYQNDANATIARSSQVDSRNEIQVNAAALSEIDPQSLFGANLVAPFLEENLAPKFETTSGLQILNFGDTVRVPDNHLSQAEPGIYKYLGPNNASVDLNTEDYSNTNNWEGGVTPSTETANEFMTAITSYLTDNLGLSDSTNFWSQARSQGQKKMSMAGSLSFLEMANDARATVDPEAQINQDPRGIEFDGTLGDPDAFRTGQQTLEVTTNATHHLINVAGQFKPPGIKDFIPTAFGGNKKQESGRVENSIGATAVIYDVGNTSKATISDNTAIYTDSLKLDADTEVIHALFATSGGEAGDFAFNGVVSHHKVQNETLAQISDTAQIIVGDTTITDSPSNQSLWISADDNTIVVNQAGAIANSKKVGLGASAAISNISRDTKALIGGSSTTQPYSSLGSITVSGAVAVDAMTSGYVGSFGIAGASSKAEETTEREQFMMTDQIQMADGSRTTQQRQETVETKRLGNSFSLSVAVAMNLINDSTRAFLNNANLTMAGNLDVGAEDKTTIHAFTVGGAFAGQGKTNVAAAGAGSSNRVDNIVEAYINDSSDTRNRTVTSNQGAITLSATDSSQIYAHAGAISLSFGKSKTSTQPGGSRAVSFGISIAENRIGERTGTRTSAYVSNSNVSASQGFSQTAVSSIDVHALGIVGSLAGVSNRQPSASNSLSLAGVGSGAINSGSLSVSSYVSGGKLSTNNGNVAILAQDESWFRADAGGVAVAYFTGSSSPASKGTAIALGAAVATNTIDKTVEASLKHASDLTSASGSRQLKQGDIVEVLDTNTGGHAPGYYKFLPISTQVLELDSTDYGNSELWAQTRQSGTITAGGDVVLKAASNEQERFNNSVEALAIAVGGSISQNGTGALAGAGAGVVNSVDLDLRTFVDGFHVVADTVSDGGQTNGGNVQVTALDNTTVRADAGAVGVALSRGDQAKGALSVGASVANVELGTAEKQYSVAAYVLNSDITAESGMSITSESTATINTLAIGGALAGSRSRSASGALAGAGAGTVNSIQMDVTAYSHESSINSPSSDLLVRARDRSQIIADAGGVAIALSPGATGTGFRSSLAIGAAIATNHVANSVRSYVDGGQVTANNVSVIADSPSLGEGNYRIDAMAIGAAVSASNSQVSTSAAFSGAGAGVTNTINNTTEAFIKDAKDDTTTSGIHAEAGSITVTALDASNIRADAGGFAVGLAKSGNGAAGSLSVGASMATNDIGQDQSFVKAYIENSDLTSQTAIVVNAASSTTIEALAMGGSLAGSTGIRTSGALAGAGAGTSNTIAGTIEAFVSSNSSLDSSAGGVIIEAVDASQITSDAGGVAIMLAKSSAGAAGGLSIGIGLATNNLSSDTKAYIDDSTVSGQFVRVSAESSEINGPDDYRIDTLAIGAAVSGAMSQSTSAGLAGAGAGVHNTINNTTSAFITNSLGTSDTPGIHASTGDIDVLAVDNSDIRADAGGFAIALNKASAGAAGSLSVGASVANNEIGTTESYVKAYVDESKLTAAQNIEIKAHSQAAISALAMGGALSGSSGQGLSGAMAGAGAGAINSIQTNVESFATGNATTLLSDSLTVEAINRSTIIADAGGVAVAIHHSKTGAGGSMSIGASVTENNINATTNAFVEEASVVSAGDIQIYAKTSPNIDSLAIAGSLAAGGSTAGGLALSGAGSGSYNTIELINNAEVKSAAQLTTTAGGVTVRAEGTPVIDSDSGGVSLAGAGGKGGAAAAGIGASISENDITTTVVANVTSATISTTDNIVIHAYGKSDVNALALAGAGTGAGGKGGGLAGSGAGASTTNTINSTVSAYAANGSDLASTSGAVTISADDDSDIQADSGSGSLAGAGGVGGGAAVSVGASLSTNTVTSVVSAYVDQTTVDAHGNISITSDTSADIKSLAIGGSLGGAGGKGGGLAGSGAGAST